jgi:hypothetical protein
MALAGIPRLSRLLIISAIPFVRAAFAVETFLRLHGQP